MELDQVGTPIAEFLDEVRNDSSRPM